jgi:hypothetical protein
LTSLPRSFPAQRLTISLTSRSFLERKPLRQQRSPPSEPLPLAYPADLCTRLMLIAR